MNNTIAKRTYLNGRARINYHKRKEKRNEISKPPGRPIKIFYTADEIQKLSMATNKSKNVALVRLG